MSGAGRRVGFCVIYRWRLRAGREDAFVQAWERLTREIRDFGGGLGSRLHRCADGTWVAYAQWPDQQAWESVSVTGEAALAARSAMLDAVEETFVPLLLEPESDLLVFAGHEPGPGSAPPSGAD